MTNHSPPYFNNTGTNYVDRNGSSPLLLGVQVKIRKDVWLVGIRGGWGVPVATRLAPSGFLLSVVVSWLGNGCIHNIVQIFLNVFGRLFCLLWFGTNLSVCLMYRYGVAPENIILYGQSIGTVPTIDLAARYECAAVILHSPLMSGLRVAFPDTRKTYCFDAFPRLVCNMPTTFAVSITQQEPQWKEVFGLLCVSVLSRFLAFNSWYILIF